MNPDWHARYERAIEITRRAGELAHQHYLRPLTVEWKGDLSPVTAADRGAEQLLREQLLAAFPNDGFLGEEFGDQPGSSGYRWIIDPIDGTRNFIRQIPVWGTLVGLDYRGELVAGIAYAPALDQMWHALRGNGAYRDGGRIRVSDVAALDQSLMAYTSFSWFLQTGHERTLLNLMAHTDQQRGYGDFYGFMLVAQGSCELMCDQGCHAWDLAALAPIVEEAGGKFTNWEGQLNIDRPDVLASNGRVHDAALAILKG